MVSNYLGQGWSALMGLAFIPLYIQFLGMEAYGLIGLFVIMQAWLSLLDIGMTPTLTREMAPLLLVIDSTGCSVTAGVTMEGVFGFGTTFTDLDQDGWPDLAVAGDFETSQLFWNNGNGTFTNGTVSAQVGNDENGMGSTFGNFDGDGDLDLFATSIFDLGPVPCIGMNCPWAASGNRLYRYDGSRSFSDATDAAGVRNGNWGWGVK